MYDVVVIGGGPAGLYAAYCLAKAGRRVAVCEEHPEIGRPVHCTGLVAVEAFSRFTLPHNAIQTAWRSARFFSPAGQRLTVALDQGEMVMVDRSAFDRGLADQAASAGAELLMGYQVEELVRVAGGVVARAAATDTERCPITARLAIVATGVGYSLHQNLGLARPAHFVQSAQVEVELADLVGVELHFGNKVALGSFAWVVPFTCGEVLMAKIGLLASRDAEGYLEQFLQSPMIAKRVRSGSILRYRRRPIPLRPIPKTFAEHVLVVGDAAGIVKPTTGGGIYYSLLTGELAATTACESLATGDHSVRFLSRYQMAWQGLLSSEIRMGTLFRYYVSRLSDAAIDEAFRVVGSDQVARLIRDHASFNWHRAIILALWRSLPVRRFLWSALVAGARRAVGREVAPPCPRWFDPVSRGMSFVAGCTMPEVKRPSEKARSGVDDLV